MTTEQLTKRLEAEYEKEVGEPMSVFNMCLRPFRSFLIQKIKGLESLTAKQAEEIESINKLVDKLAENNAPLIMQNVELKNQNKHFKAERDALALRIKDGKSLWVARNEDNILVASSALLHTSNNEWCQYWGDEENDPEYFFDEDWFPNLKWEDEPIQVALVALKEGE